MSTPISIYRRLAERLGPHRTRWLSILLLIGAGALTIRLLIATRLDSSALLYMLVPYAGALLLTLVLSTPEPGQPWWRGYLNFALTSLVVFLGSSVVLGEGFICVIIFAPIYFAVATLAFLSRWLRETHRSYKARRMTALLPMFVVILSLEGAVPGLAFNRVESVQVQREVPLPATEVMARLQAPVDLDQPRHWLLTLFPAPEPLTQQNFAAGAIHEVTIVYPRWFVTNVHSGTLQLEIEALEAQRIATRVRSDSTLFANYMALKGTELQVEPRGARRTLVVLTVHYNRKLDPYWYFGPVMRFGVARMAEFLIDTMAVRDLTPTGAHHAAL